MNTAATIVKALISSANTAPTTGASPSTSPSPAAAGSPPL
jgi:hypothetical protein